MASARREGEKPHASEVLTPAAVFLNGARVADLGQAVSLRAGANPLLVRYDQAGRGYFVLKRDGADSPAVAAHAAGDDVVRRPGGDPFRRSCRRAARRVVPLHRAAGLPRHDASPPKGKVEAWADGQPMRAAGGAVSRPSSPLPRAAVVALRVVPETGASGGAVFPDPVRLECGRGVHGARRLVEAGRWSATPAARGIARR